MRRLKAWLEDRHVGAFVDDGSRVEFVYDEDTSATVSLSLPREGRAAKSAAGRFLENLLPENPRARRWMAEAYGVDSLDAIDLLTVAGGDVAGGLVLLPEGQEPAIELPELNPALDRDIAASGEGGRRLVSAECDSALDAHRQTSTRRSSRSGGSRSDDTQPRRPYRCAGATC